MTDPTSLPNFPPPAGEHPLRGRVIDVLQDEGFRPNIDTDGDVSYKVQGQQLFVRCVEGDVDLMRVFGQWQVGEEVPKDLLSQLRSCNDLSLGLNLVKVGIASGTLVVASDHVVGEGAQLSQLLEVSTNLVLSTVQMWHQAVTGGPPPEGTPDFSSAPHLDGADGPAQNGGPETSV